MIDHDFMSVEEQDNLLAAIIEETILMRRQDEIYNKEDYNYVC